MYISTALLSLLPTIALSAAANLQKSHCNMAPITLTNIISVYNETAKVQREKELFTNFIAKVDANEPGVLEFQLNLDEQTGQFLTYEKYRDQHAIDIHLNSTYLAELEAAEAAENLKSAPNQVYFLTFITQFNHKAHCS